MFFPRIELSSYYRPRETGLYYLQTRYYDPAIGRFINADTFATTDANGFLSCNMFAYCENDPVNREDRNGEVFHIIAGALVGGASAFIGSLICGAEPREAFRDALWGAATGALSAAIPGAGVAIDVMMSATQSVLEDIHKKESASTVVLNAFASASLSVFSGFANDFITTKAATNQLKSSLHAIPKMLKGNHPKVKVPAKHLIYGFTKRAAKSFASSMAWNTGVSGATKWVTRAIRNTV